MPEEAVQTTSESTSVQEPSSSGGSDVYHHKLGESPESRAQNGPETVSESGNGERAQEEGKKESRYERTKRERAAYRAEMARREAALQRREAEFAQRERAAQEAAKPKRDYTIAELQKYRAQWENEGRDDLVRAADKEIAVMADELEAERAQYANQSPVMGTPEHRAQWEQAEAELFQSDPEFMRNGTRLDVKLREIMGSADGNIYRQHPRGIVAAYHRAKMELLDADLKELQTTNSRLETELKRYQGYTSIGSGAPARVGTGSHVESLNDFQRLSTKDMRKHLLANADKHGVPWF